MMNLSLWFDIVFEPRMLLRASAYTEIENFTRNPEIQFQKQEIQQFGGKFKFSD